ncbi:unnamed protein product [Phytomonas sp. Hart1]|nr:unnamed protein product [Phytomonas sp. Hart1]|eukprot:CCW66026.1 unnamed protein product [Phytomonas sp. isolate Hart1]
MQQFHNNCLVNQVGITTQSTIFDSLPIKTPQKSTSSHHLPSSHWKNFHVDRKNNLRRRNHDMSSSEICDTSGTTLQSVFHLHPLLVVCFVRHVDLEGMQVATPQCVEGAIRELQGFFSKPIPTSSIHPQQLATSGGDNTTERVGSSVTIQFGKALEVFSGSGDMGLNIFLYSTNESYSRPRSCANIAKEWRAQLAKTGEKCSLVILHHRDFVSPEASSLRDLNFVEGTSKGKSLVTPDAKIDTMAVALKSYYTELRSCRFSPQQICTYVSTETPKKLLECIRIASIKMIKTLKDRFHWYLEKKQSLPMEKDLGNPNYTRHVPTYSSDGILLLLPSPTAVQTTSCDSDHIHDRPSSVSSVYTSPLPSGIHSRSTSSMANSNSNMMKTESVGASLTKNPLARTISHKPNVFNATQLSATILTTWSIHQFWQLGLDLARYYLSFGFLREASAVFDRLYMEYYNNSDDYSFVSKTETLERLGWMQNLFDLYDTRGEMGLTKYPKALEHGAELIDGFLLITAHAITCVTLLDGQVTTAKKRFFDTFINVVQEKFTEPPAALFPRVHRDYFLLKCFLSGLSTLWPTYGLTSSTLRTTLASPQDIVGYVERNAKDEFSSNSPTDREGSGAALSTTSYDLPQLDSSFLSLLKGEVVDSDFIRDEDEDSLSTDFFSNGKALEHKLLNMIFREGTNTLNDSIARLVELVKFLKLVPSDAVPAVIADDADSLARVRRSCVEIAALVVCANKSHLSLCEAFGYNNVATCWEGLNIRSKNNCSNSRDTDVKQEVQGSFQEGIKFSLGRARQFWRYLTALAAAALGISGEHRRECTHYGSLALSFFHENPKLTATIAANRLIPFIRTHRWCYLEYTFRLLYVESLHKLFSLIQTQEQSWDAETKVKVWSLLFNIQTPYALFKESLLFLIGFPSESSEGCSSTQPNAGIDTVNTMCKIDYTHSPILYSIFPSRTQVDFWEMVLHVDALVEFPLFKGKIPKFPFDLLLRNQCVWAAPLDKLEGLSTPTTKQIHLGLLDPVNIFLNFECPVDILRSVFSSHGRPTMVCAVLESRKEWSNSLEMIHILKRIEPSTTCYNPNTHRMELQFSTTPCHAGHYRLRCLKLVNGSTRLVYYPFHDEVPCGSMSQANSSLNSSKPARTQRIDNEVHVLKRALHLHAHALRLNGPAALLFSCTQVLFHVSEPAGKVRLSIRRLPCDEHCFADALSYFTVFIEMEEPLEIPALQSEAALDSAGTFPIHNLHPNVNQDTPCNLRDPELKSNPLPPRKLHENGQGENPKSTCCFKAAPDVLSGGNRYHGCGPPLLKLGAPFTNLGYPSFPSPTTLHIPHSSPMGLDAGEGGGSPSSRTPPSWRFCRLCAVAAHRGIPL